MHVTTFYKENTDGPRAEIHQNSHGYYIEYYNIGGLMINKETYDNASIHFVSEKAQNWIDGIKTLHG